MAVCTISNHGVPEYAELCGQVWGLEPPQVLESGRGWGSVIVMQMKIY